MLEQVHYGYGGLNLDNHVLSNDFDWVNDYLEALNIRFSTGEGNKYHIIKNVKGNVKSNFDLPTGTNTCIGAFHDQTDRTLIFMVHNSSGNHSILRYFLSKKKIEKVAQSSVFNFDKKWKVTGLSLIDKKIFQWTDGKDFGSGIEGNPPRKLNIEKANDTTKNREYRVYAEQDDFFTPNTIYQITIKKPDGTVYNGVNNRTFYTVPPTANGKLIDGWKALATALNNTFDVKSALTAEACGCYLTVTMKFQGEWTATIRSFDTVKGFPDHQIFNVPYNFYPTLTEYHIDLVKYPPKCGPTGEYKVDSNYSYNYVEGKTFQFRYRFVYDDWEKSAWSPIGPLVYDKTACGNNSPNNYIEIDYSNSWLVTISNMAVIRYVELAFREGNEGAWKLIDRTSPCEWDYPTQTYDFYNDGAYISLADDDVNTQFHSVPRKALSHDIVKNRGHWAGLLEGFNDYGDCVDMETEISFEEVEVPKTHTLIGYVWIHNPYYGINAASGNNQPIHDLGDGPVYGGFVTTSDNGGGAFANTALNVGSKYKQTLPLGGFTVYLAGTPYQATTVQVENEVTYADATLRVYDSSSDDPERQQIRTAMIDSSVYSRFEIKNIPPGKYVVRVASNYIRRDDENGTIHNLNRGLGWQRTSLPLAGVGGRNGIQEIVVDLSDPNGGTTTLDLNSQSFIVYDLSFPDTDGAQIQASTAIRLGYVLDAEGVANSVELRDSGQRVEYSETAIRYADSTFLTTDHNGFFYFTKGYYPLAVGQIATDGTKSLTRINNNSSVLNDWDQDIIHVSGNIGTFWDSNDGVLIPRFKKDFGTEMYIIPNRNFNANISETHRTRITGTLQDSNGTPVPDATVISTKASRIEKTDSLGQFSILVYRGDNILGRKDSLIFINYEGCKFTMSDYSEDYDVPIGVGENTNSNPFDVGVILVDNIISSLRGYLRRGGVYSWAVKYEDRGNRQFPLARRPTDRIVIPFHTENSIYGKPIVKWKLNHVPPEEATHYRIVRTKVNVQSMLTWVLNDVKYVTRYFSDPSLDQAQETSYEAGDATEIYLGFKNLQTYRDENTDSLLGFPEDVEFEFQGELIRLIFDAGAGMYDFLELEVKGRRGDYLVVEAREDIPKLTSGVMVHLSDPRRTGADEDLLFYEVSECFDILDPHTEDRRHGAGAGTGAQAQIVGTQPAIGEFQYGDTYWLRRNIPVSNVDDNITARYTYEMESESVSDFYESKADSIGRPSVQSTVDREIYLPTFHRFSGTYVGDSEINRLNEFIAGNGKEFPRQYGPAVKLAMVNNVLLQIHKEKCVSIYIEERILVDASGQQQVSISDEVLGSFRVLQGDYGTSHPESAIVVDSYMYFWCQHRKKVMRYSLAGLDPVNFKMDSEFQSIGTEYDNAVGDYNVYMGYDGDNDELLVTFSDSFKEEIQGDDGSETAGPPVSIEVPIPGRTLYYREEEKRWRGTYSFVPEYYGRVGELMMTFLNGEMWIHNQNETRNNFYGEQYKSRYKIVVAPEVDLNKFWKAMQLLTSTGAWDVVEITNSQGQTSRIKKGRFEKTEKDYYSDFLRDLNSPGGIVDGEVLRSPELIVTLEQDATEESVLKGVRITAEYSHGTVM